ncbi:FlgO family outer membrane protein [Poseidonibacter sp.]|uniref:FlgO family outer membrane protein n=1 Tax=Poseidonibacter sp. TaxID=2321188 RepID=UPI003C794541
MKIYASILLILMILTGCSSSMNEYQNNSENIKTDDFNYKKYYKKYNGYSYDTKSINMINYKLLTNTAIKQIFENLQEIPKIVVVTDFVELSSLRNNSTLGYILSNSIKDSIINTYKINVIESELSKYFKLSSNGLRLLTRDINKVKSKNFNIKNAVVGTYTQTKNELIIFIKLIDIETGLIKGSYSTSVLISEDYKPNK